MTGATAVAVPDGGRGFAGTDAQWSPGAAPVLPETLVSSGGSVPARGAGKANFR